MAVIKIEVNVFKCSELIEFLGKVFYFDHYKLEAGSWRNGQKYRCVIKDAEGNTLTSDAATLTVTQ